MLYRFNMNMPAKRSFLLAAVAIILIFLTACGSGSNDSKRNEILQQGITETSRAAAVETETDDSGSIRIFTDELGHKVEVPENPQHIFAPYMEDYLLSLNVIPVAQWANGENVQQYLQEQLKEVPKADFAGGLPPSPEVVMSFKPDLIILHTATYAENGVYEQYSKIAPTYVFNNASGDIEQSITKLGELINRSDQAEEALRSFKSKVDEARSELAGVIEGKNAVIIRASAKGLFLMGGNYFGGYVLAQELGLGQSKLIEGKNSVDVSLEVIPELDADYVFLVNVGGTGTTHLEELTQSGLWKSVPAAQNGHVYEVNEHVWVGSGLIAYSKVIDEVLELIAP